LKEIAKDVDIFRNKIQDLTNVSSSLSLAKTLLQKTIIALLKGCQQKITETDHINNQRLLLEYFKDYKTLPAFVSLIKMKGNENNLEKLNNFYESTGILYFLLQTLEDFHSFILSRNDLEFKKFKEEDTLTFLDKVLENEKRSIEGKPFYQDDVEVSLQKLTLEHVAKNKENGNAITKKKPEKNKTPVLINQNIKKVPLPKVEGESDNSTPCMENAAGLKCEFTQCKRKHGSKDLVTGPLMKIGRKQCCRGKNCKKNQTLLLMKNGFKISLCPDLHHDNLDDSKKELGKRWAQFSEGKISYEMIFDK